VGKMWGKYQPGEVIAKTVRNKTAYIIFFTDSGLEIKETACDVK